MKIRIKGNSIRLRLTKSEVEAFGKNGYIEERTEFGNHLFMYALRVNPDAKELMAGFVGIKITVQVPAWMANEWTTTEQVGYSNVYTYDNGKQLSILLEKDFVCLDAAVTEDQSDNFENPLHTCGPVPQVEAAQQPQVEAVPQPTAEQEVAVEPEIVHYQLADVDISDEDEEPAFMTVVSAPEYTEPVAAVEEPVEAPVHETVGETRMVVDAPAVESNIIVEEPAVEPVIEAVHVANEASAVESYTAVEMPTHEPVVEVPIVTEEIQAVEEPQPVFAAIANEEQHTIAHIEPVAEVVHDVVEQPVTSYDVAEIATVEPIVDEAPEQHPWLEAELEETPAAPVEATPIVPRTGPVRPPNWR